MSLKILKRLICLNHYMFQSHISTHHITHYMFQSFVAKYGNIAAIKISMHFGLSFLRLFISVPHLLFLFSLTGE